MKSSLAKKSLVAVTLSALLLFSFETFADGLKVTDGKSIYVTKIVTAENVKGVEVRLAQALRQDGCNSYALLMTNVRVSGKGDGWHDKYFFDAGITQTLMYCPRDKPVTEIIYSKPVFIKSFANENVNNKVVVTIVIPSGY